MANESLQQSAEILAERLRGPLGLNIASRTHLVVLLGHFLEDAARWTDLRQMAYSLATAHHETGRIINGIFVRYAPIEEVGNPRYFTRYDPHTQIGKNLGNTQPGDGVRFKGRGYVQLTGRDNYAKAQKLTGLPLLEKPELACDPEVAYQVMAVGMHEGMFTSKKLADFINADRCDYVQARRIINRLDRAEDIAQYARTIEAVLLS